MHRGRRDPPPPSYNVTYQRNPARRPFPIRSFFFLLVYCLNSPTSQSGCCLARPHLGSHDAETLTTDKKTQGIVAYSHPSSAVESDTQGQGRRRRRKGRITLWNRFSFISILLRGWTCGLPFPPTLVMSHSRVRGGSLQDQIPIRCSIRASW